MDRSYTDFQKFLGANLESAVVEIESAIGRTGGKCLLTIHFVDTSLMLAFVREANISGAVVRLFDALDAVLGANILTGCFL